MSRYIFDLEKWYNNTSKDAKDWVEEHFPEELYGNDISIFEAWTLRALLEQAYMAGKESVEDSTKICITDCEIVSSYVVEPGSTTAKKYVGK